MADRGGASVLARNLQHTVLESGPRHLPPGDRVAIVASYGPTPEVSRSLGTLISEFERLGYRTVLVRASEDPSRLEWPLGVTRPTVILRKPNLGYDFGSWAVGVERCSVALRRRFVILANDSLVGPFAPLDDVIAGFERSTADVWAATSTHQFVDHLQSYLLGFRNGVLADSTLRQFFRRLPMVEQKSAIIERYELGLSRRLFAEGFTMAAAYESEQVTSPTENPTISGWRELLRLGFPFVKRELLRNPDVVSDGHDVRDVVQRLYGTDPEGWV
jgi:hypothetical protein